MARPDLVGACLEALEDELKACVGDDPASFYDMIRYHQGWVDQWGQAVHLPRGKMLRPVLCLLSCQAVSGDYQRALPAAAAIEMIHNFSLIHDDIQDQSYQRRHRPTVWRIWGQAQAITAGDGLYVMAQLAHLRLLERGMSASKALETLRVLDKACLDLCEGQYLDISFEGQPQVDLADYLIMVGKKTAALFAASTRI
ncbi:MAG: polyprenyl synthetase family protein, partial [Dehalococcoidia bacterium]|nr:polyprenyl synthetase family protein [Dehalococcoidia bacterium]